MTEPVEGQEQEIVFTDEQQKFIDKLVGKARTSGREKGKTEAKTEQDAATADAERKELAASAEFEKLAKMHADRVVELEPFEAEAKAYRELVTGMLKDKTKALGDAAKTVVKALPKNMSDLDKLNYLNAIEGQFETEGTSRVGTPARRKKLQQPGTDKGRAEHRRLGLG